MTTGLISSLLMLKMTMKKMSSRRDSRVEEVDMAVWVVKAAGKVRLLLVVKAAGRVKEVGEVEVEAAKVGWEVVSGVESKAVRVEVQVVLPAEVKVEKVDGVVPAVNRAVAKVAAEAEWAEAKEVLVARWVVAKAVKAAALLVMHKADLPVADRAVLAVHPLAALAKVVLAVAVIKEVKAAKVVAHLAVLPVVMRAVLLPLEVLPVALLPVESLAALLVAQGSRVLPAELAVAQMLLLPMLLRHQTLLLVRAAVTQV